MRQRFFELKGKSMDKGSFKTSNFPCAYLSKNLLEKIENVNAYYDLLQRSVEKHRKIMKNLSQAKKKIKFRIKFGFQRSLEKKSNRDYFKNDSLSSLPRKCSVENSKKNYSAFKKYDVFDNEFLRISKISSGSCKELRK